MAVGEVFCSTTVWRWCPILVRGWAWVINNCEFVRRRRGGNIPKSAKGDDANRNCGWRALALRADRLKDVAGSMSVIGAATSTRPWWLREMSGMIFCFELP